MRQIKFRGYNEAQGWVYGNLLMSEVDIQGNCVCEIHTPFADSMSVSRCFVDPKSVGQCVGLRDKNGKEIYEGDIVRWLNPYRTTQTHTGDNIPNGSYTEPMEPGIKIHEGDIQFINGSFTVMNDDHNKYDEGVPISWCGQEWSLEDIREAISYGRPDRFIWDDPEEGDLQYLINEVAKVKDESELIEHLRGIEIIGNIFTTPELLTK